jgi:hypothetical protein
MSILDDIAKIPRKVKNGMNNNKAATNITIDATKLETVRAFAKANKVALSGVVELALDRLFLDVEAAK